MEKIVPIVTVFSVLPQDTDTLPRMMERIRDLGSSALQTPRDNVWVTYFPIQHGLNERQNPYVTIKAQAGRGRAQKTAFAEVIAAEVGMSLSVSAQNVWIHYEEISPSDIWHGGDWAKKD